MDISHLREEFHTIYYDQPRVGQKEVDKDIIRGGAIKSGSDGLMKKLDLAVEAEMDFISINGIECIFDSQKSLKKFVKDKRNKWEQ